MKTQLEALTPALAEEWMTKNTRNRPLSAATVEKYAKDMREGRWQANGQTIVFAKDGSLVDGQHRLAAIIQAGVALPMLVVRGVNASAFATIDNGRVRTAGDVLSMMGGKNCNVTASAARLAMNYTRGVALNDTVSRVEITEFALRHPYVNHCAGLTHGTKLRLSSSAMAAVLFLANESGRYDQDVEDFCEGLASGADLSKGDPRLTLREWTVNERLRNRNSIGIATAFTGTARAWNAWAERRDLHLIKVLGQPRRETLPIAGFNAALYPASATKRPAPPRPLEVTSDRPAWHEVVVVA